MIPSSMSDFRFVMGCDYSSSDDGVTSWDEIALGIEYKTRTFMLVQHDNEPSVNRFLGTNDHIPNMKFVDKLSDINDVVISALKENIEFEYSELRSTSMDAETHAMIVSKCRELLNSIYMNSDVIFSFGNAGKLDVISTEFSDGEVDDLVKEMKSKVNKKELIKALAGVNNKKYNEVYGLDVMLDSWARSKVKLYKLLGNKLKLDNEINVEMTASEMKIKIKSLCNKFPEYSLLLAGFKVDEIMNNEIMFKGHDIYNYTEFNKGMKVTKFLNSIIGSAGSEFMTELSKLIQMKEVKGNMTYSIDPLDILFMSHNKHNWTSCHDFTNGCYKAGTLSYIVDECTMVAYKHNGNKHKYDIGTYNVIAPSMSWRCLVVYDGNTQALGFSKSYPSNNDKLSDLCRNLLQEKVASVFDIDNKWKVLDSSRVFATNHMTNGKSNLFYNDFTSGNGDFKFTWLTNINYNGIMFNIGRGINGTAVYCPYCGKLTLYSPSSLICNEC